MPRIQPREGRGGRRAASAIVALAAVTLAAALIAPAAGAADIVTTCLQPCHAAGGPGPDVATAYLGPAETAGHRLLFNARIVESDAATLPQGSRMPCTECHVIHGRPTQSIYLFSQARTGGPIGAVRTLCEGCHRPFDSLAATPTVCGLRMKRLGADVADHGDASSRPCSDCHGPSGHVPQPHGGGADCASSGCHTSGSHPVHLSATDPRGPGKLACTVCHREGDFPYFAAGTDAEPSGHIELDETTVCDACHSPGGDYDGVDSRNGSVGAKDNWASRAYQTTDALQAGKDRWCAGCHDSAPSVVASVTAPNIAGDEDATYAYGAGYGFYKTGHGAPATGTLPWTGSLYAGPQLDCSACHDSRERHVDGSARTYGDTTPTTQARYHQGYRLRLVGGQEPMMVPHPQRATQASDFPLCYGCHDATPYTQVQTETAHSTNFWSPGAYPANPSNLHYLHMNAAGGWRWSSAWAPVFDLTTRDSRIACPTCHNVHGSTRLAMINDGSLVGHAPGLRIWYSRAGVTGYGAGDQTPTPESIPLAASDGYIWLPGSGDNLCLDCHGGGVLSTVARAPYQDVSVAPLLDFTGETGYAADGCDPDTGTAETSFTFRVRYTDGNCDAPAFMRLCLDRNDDRDFDDPGERVALAEVNPADVDYTNGKLYRVTTTIGKAGDGELEYAFEAQDTSGRPAIGGATETRTVTVSNAVPRLDWTGETGYAVDGVDPNSGPSGGTFAFRIKYVDTDGELPSDIRLLVDADDDGSYEATSMSEVDSGDADPRGPQGKLYRKTLTLPYCGDGEFRYSFRASDGIDEAVGPATADQTLTVSLSANTPPTLAWTGEPGYSLDGANPDSQAGRKPFDFRVLYADAENGAPTRAQLLIDMNDDNDYADPGEAVTMTPPGSAPNDGDFTNGEIFATRVWIPYAGDGGIRYAFYFEDDQGIQATGVQMAERAISVFNALDVPGDFGTIQAAVNAANPGDTVLVGDGTWAGFALGGRDVFVDSVNGAASTIVTGTGFVVDFGTASSDSTVSGFTIRGGTRGVNGGSSDVTLRDCVVEGASAYGVYHLGAAADPLVVERCTIRDNQGPGIDTVNNTAVIRIIESTVTGNSALNGAGIYANGASALTIERSRIAGNAASGNGGGVMCQGTLPAFVMRDSVVESNSAGTNGGGIYFQGASPGTTVTIETSVVRGNRASGGAVHRGGGLYSGGGAYRYTNVTFSGNYSTSEGGCAYLNSSDATFTNCTFAGSSANTGGGLYALTAVAGRPRLYNCILYGNEARGTAREQIDGNVFGNIEVRNTDIDQTYTGFYNQAGNMTQDPLFRVALAPSTAPTTSGDYHVDGLSPVEGRADPGYAPDIDIDHEARPQGTGDDMGSDEVGAGGAFAAAPPASASSGATGTAGSAPPASKRVRAPGAPTQPSPRRLRSPALPLAAASLLMSLVAAKAASAGKGYAAVLPGLRRLPRRLLLRRRI